MKRNGLGYSRLIPTSNLEVVAQLTAAGGGIGIIPGLVVRALFKDQLEKIPEAPHFDDEICLIYRNENKSVRAVQVLAESIRQGFN